MTLLEFINKYNGEYVEAGGSVGAKNQCVDLVNQCLEEVLGFPKILWTDAKDFPAKADKNLFDFIKNTALNIPDEGSLVVWSSNHIAIFIEGNANSFRSFDQNYPTGSPCHIQGHTYSNVVGWLKPKSIIDTGGASEKDIDIRLSILDENEVKTEGSLREVLGAYKELPVLREDKLNADKEIDRLRHLIEQDKLDLKSESDANSALKMSYISHLEQIGKELGNGSDLPGILQQISILKSDSDKANLFEGQLKALQSTNADLKAEIVRKDDANRSYSTKIDSLTSEMAQIKEILSKWLKIANVTPESLLAVLRGLELTIEKPLVMKVVEYIQLLIKKYIWQK